MKNCKSCNTTLLPHALFCHNCGKQTDGDGVVCLACNNLNPKNARFCHHCGTGINIKYTPKPNITPLYSLDFNDIPTLPIQLTEAFRVAISWTLTQEENSEKEALFLQTFEKSDFRRRYLEEATIVMTQDFEGFFEHNGTASFASIEQEVERQFTALLERFFIEYCSPLLPFSLSPKILNYQHATSQSSNIQQLIIDYLDLDEEGLISYTSAIEIPLNKLKNARTTFFFPQAGEVPYIFIDQTLLRSGKEGCIITAKAIYWKAYFHKSASFLFSEIEKLHFFGNRIEVNGIYLNINPSLNYKLYKLLSRLRTL